MGGRAQPHVLETRGQDGDWKRAIPKQLLHDHCVVDDDVDDGLMPGVHGIFTCRSREGITRIRTEQAAGSYKPSLADKRRGVATRFTL